MIALPCENGHCASCKAESNACCRCGESLLSGSATFAMASGVFVTSAWVVALVYVGCQALRAVMGL